MTQRRTLIEAEADNAQLRKALLSYVLENEGLRSNSRHASLARKLLAPDLWKIFHPVNP